MFNTRNKYGISAHPCIILYIITSTATNQRGEFSIITYGYICHYSNNKLLDDASTLSFEAEADNFYCMRSDRRKTNLKIVLLFTLKYAMLNECQ